MRTISEIWLRICAHQNEQFKTIRGKPFVYAVSGNVVTTDRTGDYPIHVSQFEKALALVPLSGPGQINDMVRGPSYVWAILDDERIRGNDW